MIKMATIELGWREKRNEKNLFEYDTALMLIATSLSARNALATERKINHRFSYVLENLSLISLHHCLSPPVLLPCHACLAPAGIYKSRLPKISTVSETLHLDPSPCPFCALLPASPDSPVISGLPFEIAEGDKTV